MNRSSSGPAPKSKNGSASAPRDPRKQLSVKQQQRNARRRQRNKERRRRLPYIISRRLYEVAGRDKWTCHLCGEPVSRGPWLAGDEDRPTLDHLIPKSEGGTYGRHNLRLAHHRCNNARGNAPLP